MDLRDEALARTVLWGERRSNRPDLPDAIAPIWSLLRVVGDLACNQ